MGETGEPEGAVPEESVFELVREMAGRVIPVGTVLEGFINIAAFMTSDGRASYVTTYSYDRPTSSTVGLLEMAKFDLLHWNDQSQKS